MIRINRVTVNMGEDFEPAVISMYRTNTKLIEIDNTQIGIPMLCDVPEVGKVKYQQYCKDTAIHLLEQGGIEGYYWEPKKKQVTADGKEIVRKFNKSTFRQEAANRLSAMLEDIGVQFTVNQYTDDTIEVQDRYKDGNIKYGWTIIAAKISSTTIKVKFELRSGQMCKPKQFMVDDQVYSFNTTNIGKLK